MLCVFALIIVSHISYACDKEIEYTKNQCTKQINYLKETMHHTIQEPFLKTIYNTRPHHTRDDLDFVNWAVDCIPFVDWQAWPEILSDYQKHLTTPNSHIIPPPFLFQVLCSRSNSNQRTDLLDMLCKLPQHVPSSFTCVDTQPRYQ